MIYAILSNNMVRVWIPDDPEKEKEIILSNYPENPFLAEIIGGNENDLKKLKENIKAFKAQGDWYFYNNIISSKLKNDIVSFRCELFGSGIKAKEQKEIEKRKKIAEPIVDALICTLWTTSEDLAENYEKYYWLLDFFSKELTIDPLSYVEKKYGKYIKDQVKEYIKLGKGVEEKTEKTAENPRELDHLTGKKKVWKYWLMILGKDELIALKYKESKIKKKLEQFTLNSKLKRLVYKTWNIGESVEIKTIKEKLNEIYKELKIKKTAKGSDITEFYQTEIHRQLINGKDLRVYKLISKK